MKIYLSGPMTGLPYFNYPAFNQAAEQLRAQGYDVFNPAEAFDGYQGQSWSDYLRHDLAELLTCDAVAVLDGWERSAGAMLEVAVAVALELNVWTIGDEYLDDTIEFGDPREFISDLLLGPEPTDEAILDETILEEAGRLVHGDRQSDYGHPYEDFRRTALIWTGLFIDRLLPGESFSAADVPLAMQGIKLSREINHPKRDNRVDGAGYWATLQMVRDFEADVTRGAS